MPSTRALLTVVSILADAAGARAAAVSCAASRSCACPAAASTAAAACGLRVRKAAGGSARRACRAVSNCWAVPAGCLRHGLAGARALRSQCAVCAVAYAATGRAALACTVHAHICRSAGKAALPPRHAAAARMLHSGLVPASLAEACSSSHGLTSRRCAAFRVYAMSLRVRALS